MSKPVYSNFGDFEHGLEFSISKPNQDNMNTEVLKVGTYLLPDDCTVSVVKGKVIVHQKRKSFLKEGDHRCKDCKFNVKGHTIKNAWYSTNVCLLRPKRHAGVYYAVRPYDKTCDKFQLKKKYP